MLTSVMMVAMTIGQAPTEADYRRLEKTVAALERRIERLETELDRRFERAEKREAYHASPPLVNPLHREWCFLDGGTVEGTLIDCSGGDVVLLGEDGKTYRLRIAELCEVDRKFVGSEVRSKVAAEEMKRSGRFIDCPNKNCKRGTLYGPATGGGTVHVGGAVGEYGVSGLVPVGRCPVCGGRGVVDKR